MSRERNLFLDGKKVNYNEIRRGAKTTDCHIFIHNFLLEDITEIQVNYQDYYDKKLMKSKIVNMALMLLSDEISKRPDNRKLKYIRNMEKEYLSRYN